VVVKVRRPGARDQIEQDLEILEHCVGHASRHSRALRSSNAAGFADEFARILRAELDYEQEGRDAERFADSFADDPEVQIPARPAEHGTPLEPAAAHPTSGPGPVDPSICGNVVTLYGALRLPANEGAGVAGGNLNPRDLRVIA
jgi:ABC1 family protein